MINRTAVFAGTFDPFTIAHEHIVNKAQHLFDKIIIAIGENSTKTCMLSTKKRKEIIEKVFNKNKNFAYNKIEIKSYSGLTVDFCKQYNCRYILRGLRNSVDFEYEKTTAGINKLLNSNIETVFILSETEYSFISSSVVREIVRHNGDLTSFLPSNISTEEFYSDYLQYKNDIPNTKHQ